MIDDLNVIDITPWKLNPRSTINEKSLADLAESIKSVGIIQPITVRHALTEEIEDLINADAAWVIVAGERRYRAAVIAGMETIPAIVKTMTKQEAIEISIIENLQRDDINPVEEARAFKAYLLSGKYTYGEFAERIGKSYSYISSRIKLLELPDEVLADIMSGEINVTEARKLVKIMDLPSGMDRAREYKEMYSGWGWKYAIEHAIGSISGEISDQQQKMNLREENGSEIAAKVAELITECKNARVATEEDSDSELHAKGYCDIRSYEVTEVCETCERRLYLVDARNWGYSDVCVRDYCPDAECYMTRKKECEAVSKQRQKIERDEFKAKNLPRKEFMQSVIAGLGTEIEISDIELRYVAKRIIGSNYIAEATSKKICQEMGWTKEGDAEWSACIKTGINNSSSQDLLKLILAQYLLADEELVNKHRISPSGIYASYLEERGFIPVAEGAES